MKRFITIVFLFSAFALFAQKDTLNGAVSRYSIAPTAFGLNQGQFNLGVNGPFFNQIFYNIQNPRINKDLIGSYLPSNFYSASIGLSDFLSTSIGLSPIMLFYNFRLIDDKEFRYLPFYTNTKMHFKITDNLRIGGGLFTFNLPNEGERTVSLGLFGPGRIYTSEVNWDFIPNRSVSGDSSFIMLPYGVITIGSERNNISLMVSNYNFFSVSGKLKLNKDIHVMSENFFINHGLTNNVRFHSIMLGYSMNPSDQFNCGLMYLGAFDKQNKLPFMLSYSAVFDIDIFRSKKRNPKNL